MLFLFDKSFKTLDHNHFMLLETEQLTSLVSSFHVAYIFFLDVMLTVKTGQAFLSRVD